MAYEIDSSDLDSLREELSTESYSRCADLASELDSVRSEMAVEIWRLRDDIESLERYCRSLSERLRYTGDE